MKDLLDPLVEPFDDDPGDWPDVVARAGTHGSRLVRRSLVAAAFVLAALALTVPLGLAGHIVGLFHAEGKPVPFASLSPLDHDALVSMCRKVQLVTPRGKPPESRCNGGEPKIEEIARNDTRVYWKVTYRKQFACVASWTRAPQARFVRPRTKPDRDDGLRPERFPDAGASDHGRCLDVVRARRQSRAAGQSVRARRRRNLQRRPRREGRRAAEEGRSRQHVRLRQASEPSLERGRRLRRIR